MKKWLNEKIQLMVFMKYMLPCLIGNLTGRWFYFRNTPTWVVVNIATMGYTGDDQDLIRFQEDAQQELYSRVNKLKRELEQ